MKFFKNQQGQIVVEYLLLMVVVVSIAAVITKTFVARSDNPSEQGMVIKGWNKMIQFIGNDLPECSRQTNFSTANCP